MKIEAPTKAIKELCLQLGSDYGIKVVDRENVIYRNLGNGYDIEVSRLDTNRSRMNATIYVWKTESSQIVDIIKNINSFEKLKQTLSEVSTRYLSL